MHDWEADMFRQALMVTFSIMVGLLAVLPESALAAGGRIKGRVSLVNAGGQVVYGDWVRVYLVTAAVDIPQVDLESAAANVERASRINSAHTAFFIAFREMMNREGYHLDDKLTRPDGSVAFNDVSPGRYYLVVTFPTMIAGQKAAWQVPVDVVADMTVPVELNAANAALPGR
jgi:hypothetical protein